MWTYIKFSIRKTKKLTTWRSAPARRVWWDYGGSGEVTGTATGGPPAYPAGSAAPSASPCRVVVVGLVASSSPPTWQIHKQECIPVGCVLSAAVAVSAAPVNRILDTRYWKHYLSSTSFADGNNWYFNSEHVTEWWSTRYWFTFEENWLLSWTLELNYIFQIKRISCLFGV